MKTKYYLGPMSLNIVNCVLDINNENKECIIGLIPSRRQIEFNGGYVNNWTTQEFSRYVTSNSKYTILQRDHGGRMQGSKEDNGKESYLYDIENGFNLIHIDPWKSVINIQDGCVKTVEDIEYCLNINKNIKFEIGTEEAIYPYNENDLNFILNYLKLNLGNNFQKIQYAVVQGGTKLKDSTNIGIYDLTKLKNMCDIVSNYGLSSKEHNGDYLTVGQIKDKFNCGLSAINIAPEFGVEETKLLLSLMNQKEVDIFYNICLESGKWKKWVSESFDLTNKAELIKICGHYNFMSDFIIDFKTEEINNLVKSELKNKILEKIK